MKLKDYQEEWKNDCKIDKDILDDESLNSPYLHSKYMNYLSDERLLLKKLIKKREETALLLNDYYSGLVDGKDIGRNPWPYKSETKAAIQKRVDNDPLITKMQSVIDEKEEITLFIKEVVYSINQRGFTIKNAIDFIRWTNGG